MRWKWILAIGVLVVAILITAAYAYLNTYDYNKLKPLVAKMVEDATGRKLILGGEVTLEIGLAPALVVTDVALANVSWGSQPQMIEIDKVQARVRLLPLLVKNLDILYFRLIGVKVLLETGPKDQGNWDVLAGSNATGRMGAFTPAAIEVSQINIENLHLTYRENRTGTPTQFTLANLEMNRHENEDGLVLKLKADFNGQAITLSGKTGFIRNIFAHQHFPLALSGTLAKNAIDINGAIDDILTLQGIDVTAQVNGKNIATLGSFWDIQLPKTQAFDVSGHLKGSKDSLRLDNINGNLTGNSINMTISGSVGNVIAVSGVDLNLKSSGKDLAVIAPVIGENLPATDQFEIQGHLSGSSAGLRMKNARGSARRGELRFAVNGAIEDLLTLKGMDLQSQLKGEELAEIGPLFGTKLPGLGPFDISGKFAGSTKTISLNAVSATVDNSDFAGLAKLEFLERPKITIRLESSVIDFTRLIKSLEQDKETTANTDQKKRRLFSDDPLPLEALKKVDADIVVKAKNIHAKDAHFKSGNMTVTLEDGAFNIETFEATYKQTKLSGDLHANHGSPTRVTTKFLVQNFDLGSFLKETGRNDQVQATVDIAAHLDSSGDSVHSLMANLDGGIGVVMGQGFLTKYLDLLFMDLSQKVMSFW